VISAMGKKQVEFLMTHRGGGAYKSTTTNGGTDYSPRIQSTPKGPPLLENKNSLKFGKLRHLEAGVRSKVLGHSAKALLRRCRSDRTGAFKQ